MKYVCELCGMIYDEDVGDVKRGIPAGTGFADLPGHFECPGCGSEKEAFCAVQRNARSSVHRKDDRAFWQDVKYSDDSGDSLR